MSFNVPSEYGSQAMPSADFSVPVSHVWSAYGHRFMDTGEYVGDSAHSAYVSCLTCGAQYMERKRLGNGYGEYVANNGDAPFECSGRSDLAHGYESVCEANGGRGVRRQRGRRYVRTRRLPVQLCFVRLSTVSSRNEIEPMVKAKIGDVVTVTLPWSEVCMHMRVADRVMSVRVQSDGAQLIDAAGREFSFPITYGEAGIHVVSL